MSRRIVLGSADPVLTERVRSAVGEIGDEVVRIAATSAETLGALAALSPDILMVSDRLGPVPVLDLIRQATRQDPRVGVLLIAAPTAPEFYRQAMEAGARSVAPLTFTVDDLGQRIEIAAAWTELVRSHLADQERNRAYGSGHVIVLSGSKGGVGTTTLAVHTALQAVADGRRVCLVDFDLLNGDVGALLDISHRRDVADLVPVADEVSGQALDDALYRHPSGLHVLLAPREGERGEEVDERVAQAVLGALKSRFDVVVVDVGAHLTPAGASAVQIADRAVVVLTPDVPGIRGTRRQLELWDRLQLRPPADVGIVLNKVARASEVQPDLAERLVRLPLAPVTVPAGFRALEASINAGDPARLTDRDLRRAMARLAAWLGVRSLSRAEATDLAIGLAASGSPGAQNGHVGAAPGAVQPTAVQPTAVQPTAVQPDASAGAAPAQVGSGQPGTGSPPVAAGAGAAPVASQRARRASPLGRGRRRQDGGQTAIEFLGLLPLILITLALVAQAAIIGYGHVVAGNAAAAAARVAVSPIASTGQIRTAAIDQLGPGWQRGLAVTMSSSRSADPDAAVTVRFRVPAVVPAADRLLGEVMVVSSTAQMRFEGR